MTVNLITSFVDKLKAIKTHKEDGKADASVRKLLISVLDQAAPYLPLMDDSITISAVVSEFSLEGGEVLRPRAHYPRE